jgi:hypothetical protein
LTFVSGNGSELAAFAWTSGRLDVCPVEAVLGSLDAIGCVAGEGGALEADGRGVTSHNDVVDPWLAVGAALGLRASVLGPLFVELDATAMAPLLRENVSFTRPAAEVYRVPTLVGRVVLGSGLRFW